MQFLSVLNQGSQSCPPNLAFLRADGEVAESDRIVIVGRIDRTQRGHGARTEDHFTQDEINIISILRPLFWDRYLVRVGGD